MPLLHPDIVVERRDYRKVGCGTKVRRVSGTYWELRG